MDSIKCFCSQCGQILYYSPTSFEEWKKERKCSKCLKKPPMTLLSFGSTFFFAMIGLLCVGIVVKSFLIMVISIIALTFTFVIMTFPEGDY